ncbi:hypothetical protein COY33_00745 [candidate division WWE3 bacterium CG_4_10_14_0_2_um_filter_42_7]|uniref:EF-hand domain-containing protein n=2 Tax=Katanobacteria TaxID=422282 RepID=A0A2H0X9M5_UNCKA|nr:MAG: hypothetical protein COT51_02180 [candidate division WWE3 bacterium CG08_land_8_20_14_0_20_41_15]PIZ43846.1 MAG: hypothetical protein COY33_00745 [candidate division WWE3 bacterium CG_4_10_14_0_2_um_filter_42_7]
MLKAIILTIIFCLTIISVFSARPVRAESSVVVSLKVGGDLEDTTLSFSGMTSPKAVVTVTRDGAVIGTTIADDGGRFDFTLTAQTHGIKEYKLYATDRGNLSTSTIGYTINLTENANTSLGNIFLPPTITLDKTKVSQDGTVKFSGISYPSSTITLFFSPHPFSKTAIANNTGYWEYSLEAKDLDAAEYQVYAISAYQSTQSLGSSPFTLKIESATVTTSLLNLKPIEELLRLPEAVALFDPNGDGKIELPELFDVASAWFKEFSKSFGGTCDLNNDGRCDITDFSILMYYIQSE